MHELMNAHARLVDAWRRWRFRQSARRLLAQAAFYAGDQCSLAADIRHAAELALAGHAASTGPAPATAARAGHAGAGDRPAQTVTAR